MLDMKKIIQLKLFNLSLQLAYSFTAPLIGISHEEEMRF